MSQLGLFIPTPKPISGEDRKRRGLRRVSEANQRWMMLMRECAENIARRDGEVCADDLRPYAEELAQLNIRPTSPNAWGSIFRGSDWEFVGYRKSKHVTNNARRVSVWRLK